jgi:hypothetical protein
VLGNWVTQVDYSIPYSVKELFNAGTEHYWIYDNSIEMTNAQAMAFFLQTIAVPKKFIVEDWGESVVLNNGEITLGIEAYGLGNFYRHGFDVGVIPSKPEEHN